MSKTKAVAAVPAFGANVVKHPKTDLMAHADAYLKKRMCSRAFAEKGFVRAVDAATGAAVVGDNVKDPSLLFPYYDRHKQPVLRKDGMPFARVRTFKELSKGFSKLTSAPKFLQPPDS